MNNAPWWAVPVLTGFMALLSSLLGVGLAQYVALRLDKLRAQREDAHRWHVQRRELYAEFLREAFSYAHFLVAAQEAGLDVERNQEPENRLLLKTLEVRLLASDEVKRLASQIERSANEAATALLAGKSLGHLLIRNADLLKEFEDAVRQELGVTAPASDAGRPRPWRRDQ